MPPELRGSTMNVTGLLVPFGVVTVTSREPTAAVSLIVNVAVNVDEPELVTPIAAGPTVMSRNPKLLPLTATVV